MLKKFIFILGIFLFSLSFTAAQGLVNPTTNNNIYTINSSELSFINLTDTPSGYSGLGGRCLIINTEENGVTSVICDETLWNRVGIDLTPFVPGNNLVNISNITISGYYSGDGSALTGILGSQISNDLNWLNSTSAGILYYGINNPNSYYNSTTLTLLSQLTNDLGIGNWTLDKPSYYTSTQTDTEISNANTSLSSWADGKFVTNSGGDSLSGQYDFNGGWTSNGLSIIDGDLYAQTGYFYNITGLDVNTIKINGSILPQLGFDNQFDLGSADLGWRDLYLGGEVFSNGTGDNYFLGNVGIGTTSPSTSLEIKTSSGNSLSILDVNENTRHLFGSTGQYSISAATGTDGVLTISNTGAGDYMNVGSGAFYIEKSGNVGIGTSSPIGKLHVKSASSGDNPVIFAPNTAGKSLLNEQGLQFYWNRDSGIQDNELVYGNAGSSYLSFTHNDGGSFSERMRIDSSGNVGIGTTSPWRPLTVYTSGTGVISGSFGYSATQGRVDLGLNLWNGVIDIYDSSNDNNIRFNSAGDSWINGGNVGIGTTSPDKLLHLSTADGTESSLKLQQLGQNNWIMGIAASDDDLRISDTNLGSPYVTIQTTTGNVGIGTTSPTWKTTIETNTNNDGIVLTKNNARMFSVLQNGGTGEGKLTLYDDGTVHTEFAKTNAYFLNAKVGIGTTSPTSLLHIEKNTNDATTLVTIDNQGSSVTEGAALKVIASQRGTGIDDINIFEVTGNANPLFVVRNSGNVGIGTSSPGAPLHIIASDGQLTRFQENGTYGYYFSNMINDGEVRLLAGNALIADKATVMTFYTKPEGGSSAERMRIDSSGNVGIGTTAPPSKLSIYRVESNTPGDTSLGFNYNGIDELFGFRLNTQHNLVLDRNYGGWAGNLITFERSTGNVGIGTTSPSEKLEVNGFAKYQTPFGGFSIDSDEDGVLSALLTTADQNYNITDINISSVQVGNGTYFTPTQSTGSISFTSDGEGYYSVFMGGSWSANKVSVIHCSVYKNYNEKTQISIERKISNANDVGNANSKNYVYMTNGDTLNIQCKSDTASTTINVNHLDFTIERISI